MAQLKELIVNGASKLLNTLIVNGATNIIGIANISGTTTLESELIVNGTSELSDTLTVNGAANITGVTTIGSIETKNSGGLLLPNEQTIKIKIPRNGTAYTRASSYDKNKIYYERTGTSEPYTYIEATNVNSSNYQNYYTAVGWAGNFLKFIDNVDNGFGHIGIYGTGSTLKYIYIGSGDYNSTDNLRIAPNGDVMAKKFIGFLEGASLYSKIQTTSLTDTTKYYLNFTSGIGNSIIADSINYSIQANESIYVDYNNSNIRLNVPRIKLTNLVVGTSGTTGNIFIYNANSGSYYGTINSGELTQNRTYTLPNATGTIVLLNQTDAENLLETLQTTDSEQTGGYIVTTGSTITTAHKFYKRTYTSVVNGALQIKTSGSDTKYLSEKGNWVQLPLFNTLKENRLMWTKSDGTIYAGKHYANDTRIAINYYPPDSPSESDPDLSATSTLYINGNITATKAQFTATTDASGTAKNTPTLVIGPETGEHLEFDTNEIMAKATDITTGPLYLNYNGGTVHIGDGGLSVSYLRKSPAIGEDAENKRISGARLTFYSTPNSSGASAYSNHDGWVGASVNGNFYGLFSVTKNKYLVSMDTNSGNVTLNGNAATATALTTSAGSVTTPVYFENGLPVALSYNFTKTVPSGSSTDTTIPTSKAIWSAIASGIAANDALVYKGTIGTNENDTVSALPTTHKQGWTYRVNTAGTYAGQAAEIGDLIICITDGTSTNNGHWTIAQNNITGALYKGSTYNSGEILTATDSGAVETITKVPISQGGTNAITAADALKNLIGINSIGGTKMPIYWTGNVFSKLSTEGTATKPIYLNDGTLTSCTYELKATINAGTTKYLAYYTNATTIGSTNCAHLNYFNGTDNKNGYEEFVVGNNINKTETNSKLGRLVVYSKGTKGNYIEAAEQSSQWYTITLPSKSGTAALTSDIPTVTDYFWANIPIASSSNTETEPSFKTVGVTGNTTIGGNLIISGVITQGSDKNIKHDIQNILEKYNKFYDSLQPKQFKYNQDSANRNRFGFIAQEVEKAYKKAELDYQNDAIIAKRDNNEQGEWDLNMIDIIPLNTWQIQQMKQEIELLKAEIVELRKLVKKNG